MFDFSALHSNDIHIEEHCPFTIVQDITVTYQNIAKYRLVVLLNKDQWKHNAYLIDENHANWAETDPEILFYTTTPLSLEEARLLFFEYRFNEQIYGF